MGLLTETVIMKWRKNNREWYESKGYKFTKTSDEFIVRTKDLGKGCQIKIKCICDECGKEYDITWVNYMKYIKNDDKIYCYHCAIKLYANENKRLSRLKNSISLEQWCINNNRHDILNRWDYELNKCSPNTVNFSTDKKHWFKCPEEIHNSELKNINSFTHGQNGSMDCRACNSIGQWLINNYGENALEIYWSSKNRLNPFELAYCSNKNKVWIKCNICNFDKLIPCDRFVTNGLGCNKCSDGFSYPNKVGFNMLEQFGINFISEYSPDWIAPKRYDFYFELDNKKYILEMDGYFHNNNNEMNGQTKEDSKIIDFMKDKIAINHGVNIIRIDCDYRNNDRFIYIKNNLQNNEMLNNIFDFSIINWIKCHEFSCNSLVKTICEYWNNGYNSRSKIQSIINLSTSTIIRYLKQGALLGWCDYDSKKESEKWHIGHPKKVYCVELDTIYDSQKEAGIILGINDNGISNSCTGRQLSCRSSNGSSLHWMYYEDFLKLDNK